MTRRWTPNERHGYYVATGLREPTIDLELRLKQLDGQVPQLGRYHVDLDSLVQKRVVTRRPAAGGPDVVFDVRIIREPNGDLSLTVRSDARERLENHVR